MNPAGEWWQLRLLTRVFSVAGEPRVAGGDCHRSTALSWVGCGVSLLSPAVRGRTFPRKRGHVMNIPIRS